MSSIWRIILTNFLIRTISRLALYWFLYLFAFLEAFHRKRGNILLDEITFAETLPTLSAPALPSLYFVFHHQQIWTFHVFDVVGLDLFAHKSSNFLVISRHIYKLGKPLQEELVLLLSPRNACLSHFEFVHFSKFWPCKHIFIALLYSIHFLLTCYPSFLGFFQLLLNLGLAKSELCPPKFYKTVADCFRLGLVKLLLR